VIVILEDLHWVDSASQELVNQIIESDSPLPLLVLHTRRPEYRPPWATQARVTTLPLQPLPAAEMTDIIRARLGTTELPQTLTQLVVQRSEGNALFAEEIVGFLLECGAVTRTAGGLANDAAVVAAALPYSIQSLLAARIDQMASGDRGLLQAAAVIGRRFVPDLLAVAAGSPHDAIDLRLFALQALDLVHLDENSGEFVFKHSLVRDALYAGLLSDRRAALHLKLAEEIERRSGNRLIEVAEVLAHHYGRTAVASKTFRYRVLAAKKSLDVYSLDEAEQHYRNALQLISTDPTCASESDLFEMLAGFAQLLIFSGRVRELTDIVGSHLSRIEAAGRTRHVVLVLYHYSWALFMRARLKEALEVAHRCLEVAEHSGDDSAIVYARMGLLHVSTFVSALPLEHAERIGREALDYTARADDIYLRECVWLTIALDYIYRGLTQEAQHYADLLLATARKYGDPRAIGLGLWISAFIDMATERYDDAVNHAEECIGISLTHFDQSLAKNIKGLALALTGKVAEGAALLRDHYSDMFAREWEFNAWPVELASAIATVLAGELGRGVRMCEKFITEREAGWRAGADFARLNLAEIYLEILVGSRRPPFWLVLKNLPFLLRVKCFGTIRVERLFEQVSGNPQFSRRGIAHARIELGLGRLKFHQNRLAAARRHLTQAKLIAGQLRVDPMVARIDHLLERCAA
jgi:tetratricopeptide (TPR) repeat protein